MPLPIFKLPDIWAEKQGLRKRSFKAAHVGIPAATEQSCYLPSEPPWKSFRSNGPIAPSEVKRWLDWKDGARKDVCVTYPTDNSFGTRIPGGGEPTLTLGAGEKIRLAEKH